ncbi:hypothetical protein ZOSMA_120G00270 [Zostera marina]|uniref:START domain-containing protein n=1 Tax=Zostera marina TaxID=29655 RepID=A0A0K9Q346_ZOSMR|nr:hypothetical protein ZOSMA_120G00270 [Zostera marina]
MVRCGRRKIGRSFIHKRYFVLESRLLAYYKKKPQEDMVPQKTITIDGNCRVEDRGHQTQQGRRVYVLCVYNKKEKSHQMTMAAFNIQDSTIWKEKIELVIDHEARNSVNNVYAHLNGEMALSFSDQDSQSSPEDDEVRPQNLLRRTTIGNGPPDIVLDWTRDFDSGLSNQDNSDQVFQRKHWRLVQCQNGLRIFEELLEADILPKSCSRAMKAVTVVDASCEEIFELIMSMDGTRFEWDCSFQYGGIVEEVDGHTAIIHHRLQLDWFPMFVWPRDLCYVRYWRRNDDGSYVVLFRSREHVDCGPQPGFVRAHVESGGFNISPLKSHGRNRTKVEHLMQLDLKGWGLGYFPAFQQHCVMRILNSVAGLREWFSQNDDHSLHRNLMMDYPVSKKKHNAQGVPIQRSPSQDEIISDDDDEYMDPDPNLKIGKDKHENQHKMKVSFEKSSDIVELSGFTGNLRRNDDEKGRDCWRISDGCNFRIRSKRFIYDKTKVPAGNHTIMDLVAVDWFKDVKRIDHVARFPGCAVQVASEKGYFSMVINVQVPASTHYSMVFYFVKKKLVPGSLLQRFVDGDDEFRNSRLKLIPSVPKGSWIVRQSVGSTPCLLGKAVDCTYIREPDYLEIDVDIGSSTVANGVLGLVFGVITTLVVDMAFLVQANTYDELPEQLIGAVRVSHLEIKSASTAPVLEGESSHDPSQ